MGLTNNYWNALKAAFNRETYSAALKDYGGTTRDCGRWYSSAFGGYWGAFAFGNSGINTNVSQGFCIGQGDTAESADDYSLNNIISSGFSGTVNNEGKKATITITNTESSNLTIAEIGYFALLPTIATSSSGYSTQLCLMYRKVLSTPLVIAPGDSGIITVCIDFVLPT